MPGPLPNPNAIRRNAPTVNPNALPAEGRTEPTPEVPMWRSLGQAGSAWWAWAWSTPQAAMWKSGHEDFVARRAALEDDVAIHDHVDCLDGLDLLDAESALAFKTLIGRLAGMATGRLQLFKEMRELDNRLGLNPKAMGELRWSVADAEDDAKQAKPRKRTNLKVV